MNETKALEFLKVLLERAEARNAKWPNGVEVNAPSLEDDGSLLVDLDGAYFAIKVEAF